MRLRTGFAIALLLCAFEIPVHASDGAWTQLVSGASPPARTFPAFVYDSAGDRFIAFGGFTATPDSLTYVLSASNPLQWTVLPTVGTRPARFGTPAIYDPVRNRVLSYGGNDSNGNPTSYVWQLTLSDPPTWSILTALIIPPTLSSHALAYDPVRDRMMMFGGTDGTTIRNELWALSLTGTPTWETVTGTGTAPSGRIFGSMVYVPSGDRLVIFGGQSTTGLKNDCYALSLSGDPEWTQLAPSGTPPSARRRFAYAYDAANDRLVIHGGTSPALQSDCWALSLGASPAWTKLAPTQNGPTARWGHSGVVDPARARFLAFGGHDTQDLSEVITLSLAPGAETWTPTVSTTTHPLGRGIPIGAIDTQRSRWVVADPVNLWSLSLSDVPVWSPLFTTGVTPSAVHGRSVIYDPVLDRLVFFGGATTSTGTATNQLWQLSFTTGAQWSQLAPTGTPPPARKYHSAILDPTRRRMLVFGGDAAQNDVWALSLDGTPAWSQIVPGGTPPGSAFFAAERATAYDPVGDRLLVLGAHSAGSVDSVTALPLALPPLWTSLHATAPADWQFPNFILIYDTRSAAYDPVRQSVLMFGGIGYTGSHYSTNSILRELVLDASPDWRGITPEGSVYPPTRHAAAVAYDASHDRLLMFGGAWYNIYPPAGDVPYEDTWAFGFASVTGVEDGPAASRLSVRITPNPLVAGGAIRLSLPARGAGALEVMDLSGRLVARRDLSALEPGAHTLSLHELDAMPAGIYFARVASGGAIATARVCKLR